MTVTSEMKANAIRFLSMDAVQKANSGHPGAPLGMADIAEVLWGQFLQHNPNNPYFSNRDRFVLSNGHASTLLYSLLHLTGYDLPIEELKNFRQLGSKTPGHPEFRDTVGVETTTGPLGQGLANAVGMALAEKMLAAQFNQPEFNIVDHYTYVMLGDGCLMEGVSHEACSIAGTWKLGKLIALYDDNGISIDGKVQGWFTDDTAARFESYGWQVIRNVKGHDPEEITIAIETAQKETTRPTLIICKTIIGYGAANKQGSESVHGAPLGEEEILATRKALQWDYEAFEIPQEIYDAFSAKETGAALEAKWQEVFDAYQLKYPDLAAEFIRRQRSELPNDFINIAKNALKETQKKSEKIATRVASQRALDALGTHLPELIGGSADLTPSNNTFFKNSIDYDLNTGTGNYLRYGVREFGMTAIMNGLALHGGLKPYGATFLVFSDYCRNAIRMSALMSIPNIYVMTHDSIGLGEDGPTHQPIEHVASLRLIPNLEVWRPADSTETTAAWIAALENNKTPSLFALSRQNLTCQERDETQLQSITKGGYVLLENKNATITLIATGSEVELAMTVAKSMPNIRVVSMPCVERFRQQSIDEQKAVLGDLPRIAIEAGATAGWYEFANYVFGIDRFGASAPAGKLFEKFELTAEQVVEKVKKIQQDNT